MSFATLKNYFVLVLFVSTLCGYCWLFCHLHGRPLLIKVSRNNSINGGDKNAGSSEEGETGQKGEKDEAPDQRAERTPEHRRGVGQPIVTMFTTIRDRKSRTDIHHRLIRNWAALSPEVLPVLFVPSTDKNSSWIDIASSSNWTVRTLYSLRHNLPILKAMFQEVLANATTPFVGYANADILFDYSLTATLRYLRDRLDVANQMVLIVGRRRNANVSVIDLGSGDDLTKIAGLDYVKPFHNYAQDYFITSSLGLPWKEVPDFVVGRIGYDNWLVVKARDWNITLIDASRTLLAIHQCGADGFNSSRTTVPKSSIYLNRMLVKGFSYTRGSVTMAPFYTKGRCTATALQRSAHCNQIIDISLTRKNIKRPSPSKKKAKIKG